jgi:hypothetical protein
VDFGYFKRWREKKPKRGAGVKPGKLNGLIFEGHVNLREYLKACFQINF